MVDCVGVDNLLHRCLIHSDVTLCGIKMKTKKQKDIDRFRHEMYSCYECTF